MDRFIWHPIQDLSPDLLEYRDAQLFSLLGIWQQTRRELQGTSALQVFHERLERSWAIETGILEHLYSLDRGVTTMLVERGLNTTSIPYGTSNIPADKLIRMLKSHHEAVHGLVDFVAGSRPFSTSFIKELHQVLTQAQESVEAVDQFGAHFDTDLLRGEWKTAPNNPTREDGTVVLYCPPEQVGSEMDRLVELYHAHPTAAPEVRAAWLHHVLVQIHPFQDGNGRVARTLATLEFIKADLLPPVVNRDDRDRYITALEKADQGDLQPFIDLYAELERSALLQALSLAETVAHESSSERASVESLARRLKESFEAAETAQLAAGQVARQLFDRAKKKMEGTVLRLDGEFRSRSVPVQVALSTSQADSAHYFKAQIVEVAKNFDYYANLREDPLWIKLHFKDHFRLDFAISFHAVGRSPRGAMACTAFVNERLEHQPGEPAAWKLSVACESPFTFSSGSDLKLLAGSFDQWLGRSVTRALDLVRQSV